MQNWKAPRSMSKRLLMCAVLAATWLGVTPLYAQNVAPPAPPVVAPPAPATTTVIPNSKDNYEGDRVTFPNRMTVTIDDGKTKTSNHCLKAGTELRGVGQSDLTKVNFVVIACAPVLGFMAHHPPKDCNVLCDAEDLPTPPGAPQGSEPPPNPLNNLKSGSVVQIDLAEIQKHAPNRYGLAYGALVVPFKFQLTGAHDFTGSATVGPYLGYRFAHESYGWAMTLAGVAGASNISVTKGGSTQQLAGFSYGGAVMVEIKGGFQAGAVLGFDSVGSSQGFQYNNKPWLALELGYSFSQ